MDCNNQVVIGGRARDVRLSHSLFGETFYSFEMASPRLSGVIDVLPVTVSGRLLPAISFTGGEVEVVGQLRSYNKQVEGANRLILTIFAHSVLPLLGDPQNSIALTGYICKPPMYRVTPFNRDITDLLIAVNRAYNKSDYIPCITWGRNAHFASTLAVGTKVTAKGRVQSREYTKCLEGGGQVVRTAFEVSVCALECI